MIAAMLIVNILQVRFSSTMAMAADAPSVLSGSCPPCSSSISPSIQRHLGLIGLC
jgi:hypothetical protein